MRLGCRLLIALAILLPGAPSQDSQKNPLRNGVPVPAGAVATLDGLTVSPREFIDAMLFRYARPKSRDGEPLMMALVQEALVKARVRREGVQVSQAEVNAYVRELDARSREATGEGIEERLKKEGQDYATFLRKVPHVVGLTKLARKDFRVPADKPVSDFHLKLWVQQNLKSAVIERDASKLPAGIVVSVDGEPVSELAVMKVFLMTLEAEDIARVLNSLLQEKLIQRMLARYAHTLSETDVLTEFSIRKREFESNPVYKGIKYEDVIQEQTGFSADDLRRTTGFRVHAGVGVLARLLFSRQILEARYKEHQDRYGPVISCRHILVQASEAPAAEGKIRGFEDARRTAESILDELRKGKSFEDACRLYSADQGTRYKGGVIPEFTPGRNRYEPDFVHAASTLKPGSVSAPVRTSNGWHLIRVDVRRPAPPLDEVAEDLSRYLASQLFLKELKESKTGVDVSPVRLGIVEAADGR